MPNVYVIPVFSLVDQVAQFLEKNPRSTMRQIMEGLDLNQGTVSMSLSRLRRYGRVRRLPVTETERRVRWECGEDEEYVPKVHDGFKQKTVTTWKPCKVRDPLIDLFFGRKA